MKILLTGASGYIGTHLHSLLAKGGQNPQTLDLRGAAWNMDLRHDHIPSMLGDLMKGFDAVIHLAAEVRVNVAEQEVFDTFHSNVVTTLNVLEATVRAECPRFIFASTGAITAGAPAQLGNYALTKLHCEQIIQRVARRYGLDAFALRLYNVCGGIHVSETHLIPNIMKVLRGEKTELSLYNLGRDQRDYVDVLDVAGAFIKVLTHQEKIVEGRFNIHDVGTGKVHRAIDIVKMVEDIAGQKIPTALGSERKGEPKGLVANAGRFVPGWKPERTIDDTLRSAVGIGSQEIREAKSGPSA